MTFLKRLLSWKVLLVLLVILISYGQTLLMYFWQDDSALIFKLQNPAGPAGSFGAGIIGDGPYKYLVTPFVPFFPLFREEPFWYFLVGLISYAVAVFFFYKLATEFLENKRIAYYTTLIFAAGYIGSDIMFRVINSWQTNIGLILSFVSLLFFVRYKKKKQIVNYLLALVFYFASIEFVFIRSHSLIAFVLLTDFVFTLPLSIRKIVLLIIRQIPFVAIFYHYYLAGGTMGSSALGNIISNVTNGQLGILSNFFATLGGGFFYTEFQKSLVAYYPRYWGLIALGIFIVFSSFIFKSTNSSKRSFVLTIASLFAANRINGYFILKKHYWYMSEVDHLAGAVGMYIVIVLIYFALSIRKKYRVSSDIILWGLASFAAGIFSYYIQYPEAVFSTTHRYLSNAFLGVVVVWGGVIYYLIERYKNKSWLFVLSILITVNLVLSFSYQREIVVNRSEPSRQFYTDLLNFVPSCPPGSTFYFDVAEDGYYQNQFADFFSVGSMPESTALAMYYNLDRSDIIYITSLDELLHNLSEGTSHLDTTYSFVYGRNGLVDTTNDMRIALTEPEGEVFAGMPVDINAELTIAIDSEKLIGATEEKFSKNVDVDEFVDYLKAKEKYYMNVSFESLSEWKYQEIENISDKLIDSSWRGNRIYWHDNENEELIVDLKDTVDVGGIKWINWTPTLTPISYEIQTSADGVTWETAASINNGPERKSNEVVIDRFDSKKARYVKMKIQKTLSNDAPSISEFEVIPFEFSNLDFGMVDEFLISPLSYIDFNFDTTSQVKKILPFIPLSMFIKTDDGDYTFSVSVNDLGQANKINKTVNLGGTRILSLDFKSGSAPLIIDVSNITMNNVALDKLISENYIKRITQN